MKLLSWTRWLSLFWALFLAVFFVMWLMYLSDKFGDFADFFNPCPRDMSFEAQNAVTWMYVSAFFPDLVFVIIPYWAASLGFWMKSRWAVWPLIFATGAWFHSSLNNFMCQVSIGAKGFLPQIANEIVLSFALPLLLMVMALNLYAGEKSMLWRKTVIK